MHDHVERHHRAFTFVYPPLSADCAALVLLSAYILNLKSQQICKSCVLYTEAGSDHESLAEPTITLEARVLEHRRMVAGLGHGREEERLGVCRLSGLSGGRNDQ